MYFGDYSARVYSSTADYNHWEKSQVRNSYQSVFFASIQAVRRVFPGVTRQIGLSVVNVLAFSILAIPCGRSRLSVFRDLGRNGHHHFAVFLCTVFDSIFVEPLYRNGVGIRDAGGWIVLYEGAPCCKR
jgi:hypothetical protein